MKIVAGAFVVFLLALGAGSGVYAKPVVDSLGIDYKLTADEQGRSRLETTEVYKFATETRLTRQILEENDGHTLNLSGIKLKSAQNELSFGLNRGNPVSVVESDAAKRDFTLTYYQRDVTNYTPVPGENQFKWNIVPSNFAVDIKSLVATVNIGESILPTMKDQVNCYRDSGDCRVVLERSKIVLTASEIRPSERVSVLVRFGAGTFRGYEASAGDKAKPVIIIGGTVLVLVIVGAVSTAFYRKYSAKKDKV